MNSSNLFRKRGKTSTQFLSHVLKRFTYWTEKICFLAFSNLGLNISEKFSSKTSVSKTLLLRKVSAAKGWRLYKECVNSTCPSHNRKYRLKRLKENIYKLCFWVRSSDNWNSDNSSTTAPRIFSKGFQLFAPIVPFSEIIYYPSDDSQIVCPFKEVGSDLFMRKCFRAFITSPPEFQDFLQ